MPEEKIQPNVGAERLLLRSPLRDLLLVTIFGGSMPGGIASFMNSGSVRTACGSAFRASGGIGSRMNSGSVRRVSELVILSERTAS
jgi:hypothetical protein